MNNLFYLFLRKSKLNKLVYKILKNKYHELIEVNAENVAWSLELLHSVSPDPKNSCAARNHVNDTPRYDLQIIVPAYNVEKYIKECLDSILMQQTSFTCIVKVINDGSTDGTPQILEQYEKTSHLHRIQIIHQKNKGLSGARNTGIEHIEARYVMFLDSDDKLTRGAIQTLMEKAQETGADIVEGSAIKFLGPIVTKRYCHTDTNAANVKSLFGFAWGKVYKAEMFAKVKFTEGYWFEDTLCSFILHPMAHSISTISHNVYAYRTNFRGISRTFRGNPKVLDSFYICEQLLHDRINMNKPLGEGWAEKIACQFKLNANRIASLKRGDVDKALFILQSNLFRQLFCNPIEQPSPLVRSLQTGDYKAFKLQMTLL